VKIPIFDEQTKKIREHLENVPFEMEKALRKSMKNMAREMLIMDTKTQAMEKAKKYIEGMVLEGAQVMCFRQKGNFFITRVLTAPNGDLYDRDFQFEPPKEAPPIGSVVEVWDLNHDFREVAYSTGRLDENGWLCTDHRYMLNGHTKPASWKKWRVIKEVESNGQ
jgi:hypothetical protein